LLSFINGISGVAQKLVELFMYEGPPEILHSDQGREFVNQIIEDLGTLSNFSIRLGDVYSPQMQ